MLLTCEETAHVDGFSMSSTGAQGQAPEPDRERYPGPMAYAGIGMLNAVCLLRGGGLGWLADRALGTLPLFLLVGFWPVRPWASWAPGPSCGGTAARVDTSASMLWPCKCT